MGSKGLSEISFKNKGEMISWLSKNCYESMDPQTWVINNVAAKVLFDAKQADGGLVIDKAEEWIFENYPDRIVLVLGSRRNQDTSWALLREIKSVEDLIEYMREREVWLVLEVSESKTRQMLIRRGRAEAGEQERKKHLTS